MLEAYDDLLTADEACEALKIGKNAVYALHVSELERLSERKGLEDSQTGHCGVHHGTGSFGLRKHPGQQYPGCFYKSFLTVHKSLHIGQSCHRQ